MRLVWGIVTESRDEAGDVQRLVVETSEGTRSAIAFISLSGTCRAGERVLLNATAVDLALGTGGEDFVVARAPSDTIAGGVALDDPSGGHIVKMRYTPLQLDVLAVEEEEGPGHAAMREAVSIGGMPVVCCGLHSQLVPVAAAVHEVDPTLDVAYVMSDAAALPLALSDAVRSCREAGLVSSTVTCGQAFGGDLEAVNVHSGLLAADRVAGADIAVVAIGPGLAGTGTVFGHGGVAQGEAVNACAAVGGRAVAVLRISSVDERDRHRGVSHHSITALLRVALAPALVPVPELDGSLLSDVDAELESVGVWEHHEREDVPRRALPDALGVPMGSMGRDARDDPAMFLAAAAGGDVAARLARERGDHSGTAGRDAGISDTRDGE